MVDIDVDGSVSPCHRFESWVTRKPSPLMLVNRQSEWKPEGCSKCECLPICPTCAGFNWESNDDSGIRTTYHCESFKLEVLASAKLQALRLEKSGLKDLLPGEEYKIANKVNAIIYLINNGI
jgi:radical SAM protein with 4Fe4S-binding SPASM domain